MNFAKNLKEARERAGLSQGKFAQLLGVRQGAVCNWEKGIRTPRLEALGMIAKVLNTMPEELIK